VPRGGYDSETAVVGTVTDDAEVDAPEVWVPAVTELDLVVVTDPVTS